MFICASCHSKSACRSEVHIDIAMRACDACGHFASCFNCTKTGVVRRRLGDVEQLIVWYRNTKQLKPYRKINI